MASIEIIKCDGCGEEVRGEERIHTNLWNDWMQIKATGVVVTEKSTIHCDDAIFHFCPKCSNPLRVMLGGEEIKGADCEEGQTVAILASGMAKIASNLGRGGMVGSQSDNGSRPLRVAATECLKKAGLVYHEYPSMPDDGWYRGDKLVASPHGDI